VSRAETDWWFQAAEAAFQPLEAELGFTIVERHYHFQGNFIAYERHDARFVVEAGSDWNALEGDLWAGSPGDRRVGPIESVLAAVDPETDWRFTSTSGPVDRTAMVAVMELWAAGIVQHLDSLVANTLASARGLSPKAGAPSTDGLPT
jgi:hypothetical protein